MLETPEVSREDSRSCLDLAYMALMGVTLPMPYGTAVDSYAGKAEDEEECVDFIRECARQIGIDVPEDFEGVVSQITEMPVLKALRRRGTILVKNRGLAVSLGSTRRIVIVTEDGVVARYLLSSEREASFWDKAGTLVGMETM